jgi:hypothetical protein
MCHISVVVDEIASTGENNVGQKVNPVGLRLGVNKTWKSKWYVDPREYADTLHEDLALRKAIKSCPETKGAEISDVEIIRHPRESRSSSTPRDPV